MNKSSINIFRGILVTTVLLCSLAACTKKNGENQGLNPADSLPYDYASTKPGSWWIYGASDGSLFKRYATGLDSIMNGLDFAYYFRIDSATKYMTPEYFGKNANKYLTLIDVDGGMSTYITFVFLKENPKAGDGWRNTESKKIQGWNVDMLIESNVVRTDGVLTCGDSVYHNVVEVSSNLKAKLKLMPAYVDCGDLRVWFVKDIGIIKESGNISINMAGQNLVSKVYYDSLMSYHIEP